VALNIINLYNFQNKAFHQHIPQRQQLQSVQIICM